MGAYHHRRSRHNHQHRRHIHRRLHIHHHLNRKSVEETGEQKVARGKRERTISTISTLLRVVTPTALKAAIIAGSTIGRLINPNSASIKPRFLFFSYSVP